MFALNEQHRAWTVGSQIRAASAADADNFMQGTVIDYTDDNLTVSVTVIGGSGTHADWNLGTAIVSGMTQIVQDTNPTLGGDLDVNGHDIPGFVQDSEIANFLTASNVVGKQTIYIPASAMQPRSTSGATSQSRELATNKILLNALLFDATTTEYCQFAVQMPKSWNAGTVTAKFVWAHGNTTTNFGVRFFIQAAAFSDSDALDTAFGTAVGHTADAGGTEDDVYITAETGNITIANSPDKSDYVIFQIYRDVTDPGDTLAIDAELLGVSLCYTTDAITDA
jgi:hypothetical protein